MIRSLYVCLQVYSESVIPRIAKAASGVTGTPYNELMNSWGVYFLGFVGKYGYDRILKVQKDLRLRTVKTPLSLGRCVRKLLNTWWTVDPYNYYYASERLCFFKSLLFLLSHMPYWVWMFCWNKISWSSPKRLLWVLLCFSTVGFPLYVVLGQLKNEYVTRVRISR